MTAARAGALLLVVAAGCVGRGAVFLTIEGVGLDGVLRVPEDVDRVTVSVTDADGQVELLQKDYPLVAGTHTFPLTLAIEPGRQTRSPVQIQVVGWLAETEVGTARAKVPIVPSEVSNVTVRLQKN